MIRERTRPEWDDEQRTGHYTRPHDARVLYPGQYLRVQTCIDIATRLVPAPGTVADLACGNGDIATACAATEHTYLGDIAPGYELHGPIETTIRQIPPVDLMILAETLEHLNDPDLVLRLTRKRTTRLVVSLPVDPEEGENGEQLWAFDREGAEQMFNDAGWAVVIYEEVDAAPSVFAERYRCGVWGLEH